MMVPSFTRRSARLAAVGGLMMAVALLAVLLGGDGDHRTVVAVTTDADGMLVGQQVRSSGGAIGRVGDIEPTDGGRQARVTLSIDDAHWPVPRGSLWRVRWGGTAAFNSRYVELTPGAARAGAMRDGERIPEGDFRAPVEFDELLGTFTPPVRDGLRQLLRNSGPAMHRAGRPLRASLGSAPPAVGEVAGVTDALDARSAELSAAVRHLDGVVNAANGADPGIGRLVSGAATLFDGLSRQSGRLQATLDRAPAFLASARRTLSPLDGALGHLGDLTQALEPGVAELERTTAPLTRVLDDLIAVGPDASATLNSARLATPELNPLLVRARTLMPTLESIGEQGSEQLRCVRPYVPDIVAWFSTWGDFLNLSDGKDRYGRLLVATPLVPNGTPLTPAQTAKTLPQLDYAYPRPPGLAAGQAWLQPDCGAGDEVFDPSADAETRSPDAGGGS